MLKIYNPNTKEKLEFKPLKQNEVKVYHCGPTVYNYAHIGNLKTYVGNDVVVRIMRYLGFNVNVLMNLTDIDDKTIRDSQKVGESLKDFTEKFTKIFLKDIDKLNIVRANNIVPISTVIPEMVRMINTMLRRGFAYISDDNSIYFKVSKFPKYGKLANLDMSGMISGARIDNDEYDKDQASDFALWKAWKKEDGENFWEEEFEIGGKKIKLKGRPGWHIECSACNMKHFGQQIDLHTGGIDNLFPHHQNEVAQTEACTRKEFSKYWIHHGHLTVNGQKMAKSKGNFYTLEDLEKLFDKGKIKVSTKKMLYRATRFIFINGKYRDSIDFSFDKLLQASNTLEGIDETLKNLKKYLSKKIKNKGISKDFREYLQIVISDYIKCIEDDFNLPGALAVIFGFQKKINLIMRDNDFSHEDILAIVDMYRTFDQVLGVIDFSFFDEEDEKIPKELLALLEERNKLKKEKDFVNADKIRGKINDAGYKIIDTREGSSLEKI
ncbi:cysteine--tRNA ligase [Candidatus Gracilibacteria bacterium]|nr:MAG: cysteine--tRNA ligase [Candidatus Gracilibacteria bacterium]